MAEGDYYARLEPLLLDLARVYTDAPLPPRPATVPSVPPAPESTPPVDTASVP